MNKGHLIVIEGTDGSGKATQVRLLRKKLQTEHISTEVMEFPRYLGNPYGKLISQYLKGEFGSVAEVNNYLISLAYAGDRFLAKTQIQEWLKKKFFVIADRYVPSNKAYMSAKMEKSDRQKFIDWLDDLEYNINGIPREELVIFLYVPTKVSHDNISKRGSNDVNRTEAHDIHERDVVYQQEVSNMYLQLAKDENWAIIECTTKEGKMRLPKEIHEEVLKILKNRKILSV